ncbi:unnamed protein product [Allacma fusca]|uniref:Uncharacterized protein n=1 Tax=Allacma fusca TaxID=39272 RepID=A0A8J2PF92_9HEXA|nr:unnamed protein product [Allacma fusca]
MEWGDKGTQSVLKVGSYVESVYRELTCSEEKMKEVASNIGVTMTNVQSAGGEDDACSYPRIACDNVTWTVQTTTTKKYSQTTCPIM